MNAEELEDKLDKEVERLSDIITKQSYESNYDELIEQFQLQELETILEIIFGSNCSIDIFCDYDKESDLLLLNDRLLDIINGGQPCKCFRSFTDIRYGVNRNCLAVPVLLTIKQ